MTYLKKKFSFARLVFVALALFFSGRVARADVPGGGTTSTTNQGGDTTTDRQVFDDGSTLTVTTAADGVTTTVTSTDATNGGDGGDGKIICTELYHQGLLAESVYRADQEFGVYLRTYNPLVYAGYHFWAPAVVRRMKTNEFFTRVVSVFALPWAEHMAYKQGVIQKNNYFGAFVMAIGMIFCRSIGRAIQFKLLYRIAQKSYL
ncbi:MAG: hypothetical protein Q8O53_02410 [Candidatus Moranbacteria bacterium]|nr:hypothetical protein [Candidatus Moranbacteria bacterium]